MTPQEMAINGAKLHLLALLGNLERGFERGQSPQFAWQAVKRDIGKAAAHLKGLGADPAIAALEGCERDLCAALERHRLCDPFGPLEERVTRCSQEVAAALAVEQ